MPARKVDEDEPTIAFMDIAPWTRGHALVIPREHTRNLYEAPEDTLHRTTVAAQRLALRMRDRLRCAGGDPVKSCGPRARPGGGGREPDHLVRAGRLADGLPLPRARDPALRRRSAPAARQAAGPGRRGARRGRRGAARLMAGTVRYERDGDLALIVLDHPPLNLFDTDLGNDLLA